MGIKELRGKMGLSQLDVYNKTGVQTRIQSDIENGKRYNYVVDNVVKLADFYGVSVDFVLGRTTTNQDQTMK